MKDTDTVDQLLYDYTLKIGDTLNTIYTRHYVNDLDSVVINSAQHYVWHFVPAVYTTIGSLHVADYYIIEGIGCLEIRCFLYILLSSKVV